eukprot:Rmarinus@m.21394
MEEAAVLSYLLRKLYRQDSRNTSPFLSRVQNNVSQTKCHYRPGKKQDHGDTSCEMHAEGRDNGCGWQGRFDCRKGHVDDCEFQPVKCPHEGCTAKNLTRKKLPAHEGTCAFRLVKCCHSGCSTTFRKKQKKQKKNHEKRCGKRLVPCDLCKDILREEELPSHVAKFCEEAVVSCSREFENESGSYLKTPRKRSRAEFEASLWEDESVESVSENIFTNHGSVWSDGGSSNSAEGQYSDSDDSLSDSDSDEDSLPSSAEEQDSEDSIGTGKLYDFIENGMNGAFPWLVVFAHARSCCFLCLPLLFLVFAPVVSCVCPCCFLCLP